MTEPSLDTGFLDELIAGHDDPDGARAFVDGLVSDCVRSMAEMLAELRTECREKDALRVRRTAHSFKGASLTLRAPRLVELCRRLEGEAPLGDWKELERLADEIQAEVETVHQCLDAFALGVARRGQLAAGGGRAPMSINTRLVSAVILSVIVTAAGLGTITLWSVAALSGRLKSLHDDAITPRKTATDAGDAVDHMRIHALHVIASGLDPARQIETIREANVRFE